MKNKSNARRDEDPDIDPAFCDQLNALHDIDNALFAAHYGYQETHSATQRTAECATFAQAVYELEGIVAYVQKCLAHMREGVTVQQPERVIRLRPRRQPRDERGRFIKWTT